MPRTRMTYDYLAARNSIVDVALLYKDTVLSESGSWRDYNLSEVATLYAIKTADVNLTLLKLYVSAL